MYMYMFHLYDFICKVCPIFVWLVKSFLVCVGYMSCLSGCLSFLPTSYIASVHVFPCNVHMDCVLKLVMTVCVNKGNKV